jgi:hypothetical protein
MGSRVLDFRLKKQLQPAALLWGRYHPEKAPPSLRGPHDRRGPALAKKGPPRPEAAAGGVGAMGISGGGMQTFFSACLDTRLRACVVSGYFSTFRDSILAMHHCPCNFVPGLGRFGEMSDLAALVTPRPMLAEAGIFEGRHPISGAKAYDFLARHLGLKNIP